MYKMYKTGRDLNAQPTPPKKNATLKTLTLVVKLFSLVEHQRTSRPLTIWVTMLVFPPKEPPLQFFFFLGQMDNS